MVSVDSPAPAGRVLRPLAATVAAAVVLAGLAASEVSLVNVAVFGLQAGAVYALIGLGIALVYKATRVLNFAQGEFGTVAAFLAYVIMVGGDVQGDVQPAAGRLWWATLVAVVAGAVLAVATNALVVQRLARAGQVTSLVATVGVALLLIAAEVIVFQARVRPFPKFVEGSAFNVGEVAVSWHSIIVLAVLAAAAAALAVFFRTRTGTALLATAQEPFAAELHGVSVTAMAALAWGSAGALGAVGGVLGAASFDLVHPGFVTSTFLIPAFVGAVLGGITSMVGAVVGGLLLGMIVAAANEAVLAYGLTSVVPGPPHVATFVVLLVVLLLRPRGLLGKEA